MPRPTDKLTLLALSQQRFGALNGLVDSFPEEARHREFPAGTMNRNIRDVLAHLHHWHLLMLNWYAAGMSGEKPAIPAPGYTWKTTPELNHKIWETYQQTPLTEVRALLAQSHTDVMALIQQHTNGELFEKQRYRWTGTTSLGAYLVSATSSHYDWALALIKKAMR